MPVTIEVRTEVAQFALLMEQVLKANDHKTGWKNDPWDALFHRMYQELLEAVDVTEPLTDMYRESYHTFRVDTYRAMQSSLASIRVKPKNEDRFAREIVDIANFCMMIVDVLGKLPKVS